MIQPDFAWTFAVDDGPTRRYVRDTFIPWLQAEIHELKHLDGICDGAGLPKAFDEAIRRKTNELNAAKARLQRAESAG